MKYWNIYINSVKRNCASSGIKGKDLAYWGDNLFAGAIIYLLPFCLIALLPGLYWIFVTGSYVIAVVDLLTVSGMIVVAFVPGINQPARKIIFLFCIYLFSCALLYLVGLAGPGLVYLLASCIFSMLIFPSGYSYWPAWVNTFICFAFAAFIFLNIIRWPGDTDQSFGQWIAVSTNLIFVSFLSAALIPRLFHGLQETLDKEKILAEELDTQQQSLQLALNMLQQKNGELEQFAYMVSHDLKEPLRMVTSFMGMLKNKYGLQLDEKANTYIGFALDGGKRMQRMIDDLLLLSRTARQDTIKESVNLTNTLIEVKQNIIRLIEDSRAEIVVKTELPLLFIHKTDITSLLQNLLSNAIKFRKKDAPLLIQISAAEKKKEWLFIIEDNGIGIQQEKFDKIFEVFSRLHSQVSYEGTGIGLAICKKIAEGNGGKIWVESEEGIGTKFYFTIKK
ncbi:MAG: ATP-binding protein [Ginsengibacter sp.]